MKFLYSIFTWKDPQKSKATLALKLWIWEYKILELESIEAKSCVC